MVNRSSKNTRVYFRIRELARKMRKHPTAAEDFFWQLVRNRHYKGLKINRQFIIECVTGNNEYKFYIADFYCHELKLIIELDGHIHLKQQDQDMIRTNRLEDHGYRVVRFSNNAILYDWPSVFETLNQVVAEQARKHIF